jgi:TRAP-type mannitol/chloroaromatic compound transport system substrate-binding protein
MKINRRKLLALAPAATAAGIAAPALAQSAPNIKWRLASSFPKNIDIMWGTSTSICNYVSEITDGRFVIEPFAAGEIVPPFQVMDAVANRTVEIGHMPALFNYGKDPTFALCSVVPFGLNVRQQHAWMYHGGGVDQLQHLFDRFGVVGIPCGNTGMHMGGWFRKELKSKEDLKGLKFRTAGLAGVVLSKLGVVTQQIAPGDIYSALERGTMDAVELIGPYDDEKLGFHRVAKYYYYPGWAEGTALTHLMVNKPFYDELPKSYRTALNVAASAVTNYQLAKYDASNGDALLRLVAQGAIIKQFPQDIIEAAYLAWQDVYKGIYASNPLFKSVHESQQDFMRRNYMYAQIADFSYDAMMLRLMRSAPG